MAGKFRQTKFDPIMIVSDKHFHQQQFSNGDSLHALFQISQIAALQCLLYLSAIVLMTVVDVVSGENFVLDQLFEYKVGGFPNISCIFIKKIYFFFFSKFTSQMQV